jgi:rfaE bifunctional protein kinase chain/domain
MQLDPVDRRSLVDAMQAFSGQGIIVLGDLCLDEYIIGAPTRLSREAPIPVLEFERRFFVPGAAANPAKNIAALGGRAYQLGVVGEDADGDKLVQQLAESGVDVSGVVRDPDRPTTTKTRILAQGVQRFPQQVARVDRLTRQPVSQAVTTALADRVRQFAPEAQALVVSDYRSGVVTQAVAEGVLQAATERALMTAADSQGNLEKFAGYDLVKCNRSEAEAALDRRLDSDTALAAGLEDLVALSGAGTVVVTLGGQGLALQPADGPLTVVPAANRTEVYDVTGAGDTVVALLTMGRLAGLSWTLATVLASYGAGLVVRKLGNAVPSRREMEWTIENWRD